MNAPKPKIGNEGGGRGEQIYAKEEEQDDLGAFRKRSISQLSVARESGVPGAQCFEAVMCSVYLLGGL